MIHIILVDVNASGSLGDTPLPFGGEAKRYAFLIEQAGMISPTYERLQTGISTGVSFGMMRGDLPSM